VPAYKANNNSLEHYEESDRGPDFVRCALKSCELFKILHLSLPDNMIGEKEMRDIAYVLSRNTPLRTLNLSDNVVDAKAALVLAESLGSNSHLRELDLRNNRLGDAGVAVLMEPFISQRLHRAGGSGGKGGSEKAPSAIAIGGLLEGAAQKLTKEKKGDQQKKSKKDQRPPRKLKMKLERLLLDNNEQTEEALKHIYTALVANQRIEISVDLPLQRLRALEESAESSLEDEDGQSAEPLSPRNAVAPQPEPKSPAGRSKPADDLDPAAHKGDGQGSLDRGEDHDEVPLRQGEPLASEGELPKRRMPPLICRAKVCRSCRLLCFRDSSKPKQSCTRILCPTFLAARAQATRFKMSWSLLAVAERATQIRFFVVLLISMFLFLVLGIITPFAVPTPNEDECSTMSPITVYGAYGGFMALSTLAEGVIHGTLRSALRPESGAANLSCNRYLLMKWCQGQIANLGTFVHICFVASVVACLQNDSYGEDGSLFRGLSLGLAVIALIVLIGSNVRRARYIWRFLRAQPGVHKLLPHGFRNT